MNLADAITSTERTTRDLRDLANLIKDAADDGLNEVVNSAEAGRLISAMADAIAACWAAFDRLSGYREDAPRAWDKHLEDFAAAARFAERIGTRQRGGDPRALSSLDLPSSSE